MLTSIENLSHINNSNTNTIKNSNTNGDFTSPVVNGNKVAKAILICHPNSHSFLDRTLVLDKPIKIGRSVGHNKTSVNNGIFDCKVLSRNHAVLWFEDGKFLLRDTRSSNGTFVNTERLSKSSEESPPREVFSGDTVQFGVDVVENSRNVTHGCVIATLKLFLPNGREAKPVPMTFTPGDRNKVSLEDLYHLNQYLQESLQREQMLESKLNSLQTLMKTLRDSTELSWKALISNNNLLSRVELLEVQLKCYSKKFAEDKLREELRVLQEDKNAYEGVVKQYFQKIMDEKIEAAQQCQDLNRALSNMKTEFANTQTQLMNYQNELRELALKNTRLEKINEELEAKLLMTDEKNKEQIQKLTDESAMLYNQIKTMTKTEEVLMQTIKELETHGDYAHKQVMSLQSQVEELQKHHSDILCELVDPSIIKDKINDIDLVRSWISIYSEALRKCKENAVVVRKRVDQLRNEKSVKQQKITMLECELSNCAIELQDFREEQAELETKIIERKNELELFKPVVPDILDELNEKKCGENEVLDLQEKKKLLNVVQRDIKTTDEHLKELEKLVKLAKNELMEVTVSYAIEEDKLDLSEKQLSNLETAVRTLNEHVENLDTYQKERICIEDVQSLKKQLSEAHELAQEKQTVTEKLMKHFSEFVYVINRKLQAVESGVEEMSAFSENGSADELRSLKLESAGLVDAVNELQSTLEQLQLVQRADAADTPSDALDGVADMAADQMERSRFGSDRMVVLKERFRCAVLEKRNLECELAKLQQQYDYLKSYPYFDLYFILPVIVLIFVCIFNFGDKLSIVFGTRG